ncbi:IS200/IS605 family transposase [Lewinella sp. JB7]|uniref:IS200/IS605 family transposase n=1 Tax=Lewinella sp. JB7 TaxID=2962887 RepID=UPI0020C9EF17|nr:IS200/IS605 family transposase [Lewinella sp. JB7]MCP9236999.1 IS200/IS605 family transposase [Lewinella sp. JB7]
MPQSFIRVVLHTTFGTKYRRPLILPEIEQALHQVLDAKLRDMDCRVYKIGGAMDHVHLLHGLPRSHRISDVLREVKARSSCWMRDHGYPDFKWQTGYACHSADYRDRSVLERYIANQKAHHYGSVAAYLEKASRTQVRRTFEDEYRTLLDELDLMYEEKYLFAEKG